MDLQNLSQSLSSPPPPDQPPLKKPKMSTTTSDDDTTTTTTNPRRYKRRKVAIFFAYCGVGYQGMQKNPGAKTIEGDLEEALYFSGAVPEADRGQPKQFDWARSARTDKGVSAVGQVVSGRFYVDPPGFIQRLNSNLSPQIRVFGFKRVTNSFNAKKFCDRRRYVYLLPVFALDQTRHRDRESVLASLGSGDDELVKCVECSERGRKVFGLMGNRSFRRNGEVSGSVDLVVSSENGVISEKEVCNVEKKLLVDGVADENGVIGEKEVCNVEAKLLIGGGDEDVVSSGNGVIGEKEVCNVETKLLIDGDEKEVCNVETKLLIGREEDVVSSGNGVIGEKEVCNVETKLLVDGGDDTVSSRFGVICEKEVCNVEKELLIGGGDEDVVSSENGVIGEKEVCNVERKLLIGGGGDDTVSSENGVIGEKEVCNVEKELLIGGDDDARVAVSETLVNNEGALLANVAKEVEMADAARGGENGESNLEKGKGKRCNFKYGVEEKKRFNRILKYYEGTHNFHNFTTRTKAEDPSAKRYIVSFEANTTLTIEGIEFVKCEVIGQSFMLHQIRKMIGMAVAVMRNFVPESIYERAFDQDFHINVPTAPEVGLYLDECFFTSYNNKWKNTHEEISMKDYAEEAEEFKLKYIYSHIAKTEHKEGSVAVWLHSLNQRNYPDFRPHIIDDGAERSAGDEVGRAGNEVERVCNKVEGIAQDGCEKGTDDGLESAMNDQVERGAEGEGVSMDVLP